jgi:hypothetical protein
VIKAISQLAPQVVCISIFGWFFSLSALLTSPRKIVALFCYDGR